MGLFRKKPKQMPPEERMPDDYMDDMPMDASAGMINTMGEDKEGFVKYLYSTGDVPKEIDSFPVLKNKVLALTNIKDMKDLDWLMTHIDNLKSRYKLLVPKRNQDPQVLNKFNEMRLFAAVQFMRSMGGRERDRALLTTSTTVSEQIRPTQRKRGVLGRLKGG